MWFGVVLVVAGVILLLQNLGVITAEAWGIIWPILLIAIGVSVLARSVRRRQ